MKNLKKALYPLLLILIFVSVTIAGYWETKTFYSAFDATSTSYVYDAAGGTGATSGQYDVQRFDEKTILINVATLNSTSVDVRIEGKIGGTWGDVYTKQYTAATSYPEVVFVTENMEYIRVGLIIVSDAADDSITVTGNFVQTGHRLR